MQIPAAIRQYLLQTYQPEAILVYGSFADGSAGENSDFDALVIARGEKRHDASVVGGIVLDVFVVPPEFFAGAYDPEEFIQLADGKILLDKNGTADRLQRQICDHLARWTPKTDAELWQELEWCRKMIARTQRGDAEGYYRWHWLLTDSLEIYFDVQRRYYRGPKKALRQLAQEAPQAYCLYTQALQTLDRDALTRWIDFLSAQRPVPDEKTVDIAAGGCYNLPTAE